MTPMREKILIGFIAIVLILAFLVSMGFRVAQAAKSGTARGKATFGGIVTVMKICTSPPDPCPAPLKPGDTLLTMIPIAGGVGGGLVGVIPGKTMLLGFLHPGGIAIGYGQGQAALILADLLGAL